MSSKGVGHLKILEFRSDSVQLVQCPVHHIPKFLTFREYWGPTQLLKLETVCWFFNLRTTKTSVSILC